MPMCPCMKMNCTHAHTRIAGSEILMYDPGSAVSFRFEVLMSTHSSPVGGSTCTTLCSGAHAHFLPRCWACASMVAEGVLLPTWI